MSRIRPVYLLAAVSLVVVGYWIASGLFSNQQQPTSQIQDVPNIQLRIVEPVDQMEIADNPANMPQDDPDMIDGGSETEGRSLSPAPVVPHVTGAVDAPMESISPDVFDPGPPQESPGPPAHPMDAISPDPDSPSTPPHGETADIGADGRLDEI